MATRPPSPGSLILGMAFVLAGNIFACGFLGMFSSFSHEGVRTWALRGMMAPALTQLLWTVPLAALFLFMRRRYTVMGIAAMVVLVMLANGAAWGLWSSGILGGGEG